MARMTINGKMIEAPEGSTILEAARRNHIFIPSLCHMNGQHPSGSCRICVVEVEGQKTLQASCLTKVAENMVIQTNTQRVRAARKVLYELILSDHNQSCLACGRNMTCELQELAKKLDLDEPRFQGEKSSQEIDVSVAITRNNGKCILCRRCVEACNQRQSVGAINVQNRGFEAAVGPAAGLPLGEVACIFCGQCTVVCPVGALTETDSVREVWAALNDPELHVIAQVAPAVRVAIGEEFGIPAGTDVTGKLASAIKELRFDDVFDTEWAADLTVMEEGTEFLGRMSAYVEGRRVQLPMITSCSPGWIKYVEHQFPDRLGHLSSCKSPHMMMGALVKEYYAKRLGIPADKLFIVSIMPCTAKKFEIKRPEMVNNGVPNVDAVLTTRELADMIHAAGIAFDVLDESRFHAPFGEASGAADIFGVTGGVMEAALRTVYEIVTGREIPFEGLQIGSLRGNGEIKEGAITFTDPLPAFAKFEGFTVRFAATSGSRGAETLMQAVQNGTSPYHFIEVMGCPGGCIMGGGQPRSQDEDVFEKRMTAIYRADEGKTIRKAHENPALLEIYGQHLGKPGDARSHDLLHTTYVRRGPYNELTQETFTVPTETRGAPPEKPTKKAIEAHTSREENARLLALEAENARLRADLGEAKNTMEVFRRIIVEKTAK